MITEMHTVTLSDAVVILRVRLGPLRAWYPFLADNIRGLQDIHGFQLLPCGKRRNRCGRTKHFQPVYALSDVMEFIENVLGSEPTAGKTPIVPEPLKIDRARSWRLNKFDIDGSPITTLEGMLSRSH